LAWASSALFVSACGAPGEMALGGVMGKPDTRITHNSSTLEHDRQTNVPFRRWELLADPDCQSVASPFFRNAVEKTLDRFNTVFPPEGMLTQAGFLDSAVSQINSRAVVIACRQGSVSAFSQGNTAAISVELMDQLWGSANEAAAPETGVVDPEELFNSALAFVIYHELGHIFLGHTHSADAFFLASGGSGQEMDADNFAAGAHGRAGYSLAGANLVFDLLEKINPEGSLYHPGSRQRSSLIKNSH